MAIRSSAIRISTMMNELLNLKNLALMVAHDCVEGFGPAEGVSSGRSANQTANGRCWGLHSPIIPSFFQCVCELVHTYAGTLERRKSQSQPKPALGQKQTCAVVCAAVCRSFVCDFASTELVGLMS